MDLVTLCLGFVVLFMLLELWSRSKRRRSSVDPSRLPPAAVPDKLSRVFGHLPMLAKFDPGKSYPFKGLEAIIEEATGNVVAIYPGPPFLVKPLYAVRSERDAKILAAKGSINLNFLEKGMELAGGGLIVGGLPEQVKKHRRRVFTASLLNKSKIEYTVELAGKYASRLLRDVCPDGPGVVSGSSQLMTELTLLPMVEVTIGVDVREGNLPRADQDRFLALIAQALAYFGEMLFSPLSAAYWKIAHPFKHSDMREGVNTLYKDFILPAFYRRLKSREAGDPEPDDALKEMLSESSLGKTDGITDDDLEHVKREALIVFTTGESATGVIQWILLHLSQHPAAQEKLFADVTNVIGLKPQQARPTLADLDEMPYLDAVFKETNRLSPAMPGFARDLNDDLDIGGYTIPKGSVVLFNSYLAQTSEKNFADSGEFRPERFVDDPLYGGAKEGRETLAYTPFGQGKHRCMGQAVGTAVVKAAVCTIIQSCRVELASDPKEAFRYCRNFTHQPFHAEFRFVPRQ